jgi:hypothetical protein
MTHLRDTEFVDLLDGTLPPVRMAHLQMCEPCRATAAETRDALAQAAFADHAANPSPLFWEHFGRRVNEAIDAPAAAGRWLTAPRFALATLATVAIVLLAMTLMTSRTPVPPAQVPATGANVALDNLDADADWAIVRAAADDLDLDEAQEAGLAVRPGTADRVALDLTEAERAELIRLVQAEFKSGA